MGVRTRSRSPLGPAGNLRVEWAMQQENTGTVEQRAAVIAARAAEAQKIARARRGNHEQENGPDA